MQYIGQVQAVLDIVQVQHLILVENKVPTYLRETALCTAEDVLCLSCMVFLNEMCIYIVTPLLRFSGR